MRPDQGVRPAQWSTASWLGRSWSLLLMRLRVGSLRRFWLVWRLGGAASPPLSRGMNLLRLVTLRMVYEWRLWRLIGRRGGPLDPSHHNFIHSIKPTFPWSISFIKVMHTGKDLVGPRMWHEAGAAALGKVGRTYRVGCTCRPAVPGGAAVPGSCVPVHFPPNCVPIHKNCNTTCGTLLVSKMCMKLVAYSYQTRGFDGQIFVVRTVNRAQAISPWAADATSTTASATGGAQTISTAKGEPGQETSI
jgi:hypothetical protein